MLLLRQTFGLLLIVCVQSCFPLGCKAALDSEEISMKYIGEGHDSFYLKPSRKLLDEGQNQINQINHSSIQNDVPWFWFCLVIFIFLFFLIVVRCCIKLASAENNEASGITVHSPPRAHPPIQSYTSNITLVRSYGSSRPLDPPRTNPPIQSYTSNGTLARSHGSSRPLAPPRTSSRSLILIPENGMDQNVYFAIENPNINLFTIYHETSDEINHQLPTPNDALSDIPSPSISSPRIPSLQTQLYDLPPDYNSIITDNRQNDNRSAHVINISNDCRNSEKAPPPKYEDLH